MNRYDWNRLNPLQLGRYAEYLAKMEFTLFGFEVYSAEVDNKGIDFIIRKGPDNYYDVQVKSCRRLNYVFFPKDKFEPNRNNLLAVIILFENETPPRFILSLPQGGFRRMPCLFHGIIRRKKVNQNGV